MMMGMGTPRKNSSIERIVFLRMALRPITGRVDGRRKWLPDWRRMLRRAAKRTTTTPRSSTLYAPRRPRPSSRLLISLSFACMRAYVSDDTLFGVLLRHSGSLCNELAEISDVFRRQRVCAGVAREDAHHFCRRRRRVAIGARGVLTSLQTCRRCLCGTASRRSNPSGPAVVLRLGVSASGYRICRRPQPSWLLRRPRRHLPERRFQ